MSLDVLVHDTRGAGPRRPGRRALAVLLVVAALAWVAWQAWPRSTGMPMDPDNPEPAGTRAMAQVLRGQGVQVDVVHDRDALEVASLDTGTTLVVTDGPALTSEGLDTVAARMDDAGGVVLVGLRPDALADLGIGATATGGDDDTPTAGCPATVVGDATRIAPAGRGYRLVEPRPGTTRCYPAGSGHALVRMPAADGRPETDLLAPASVLTNDTVTTQDDAALALRLLGRRTHLVWYSPGPQDLRAGDTVRTQPRIAPAWWTPLLVLLGGAVLLTAWWRGRRLGPLAVEPLPVLVPAAETTVARGRLYRRAGRRWPAGRDHAAAMLREATRRRLTDRLGLPPDADESGLVAAVAKATGRRQDAVRELLADRTPTGDADLVRVAAALTQLEEEVRHP